MSEISATDASKRFADLLDAVEHRGETFTVVRRGRVVATIAPARHATGADLRRILAEHPPDSKWADDLAELRRAVGEAPTTDPWND
jgi:prevent-host-death family protein